MSANGGAGEPRTALDQGPERDDRRVLEWSAARSFLGSAPRQERGRSRNTHRGEAA